MIYNSMISKLMKERRKYMRITTKDVFDKSFQTKPEGLDPEEVYAFLEVIKEEMYEREKENSVLMEKIMAIHSMSQIVDSTIEPDFPPNFDDDINRMLPQYTFDNFVEYSGNQFALSSAKVVAANPGLKFNPLVICGEEGLGKTHLMHAIGHKLLATNRNLRIFVVSVEQFTSDVVTAIRHDKMAYMRNKYRNTDVLLLDDLQVISGKERTQEELFNIFNELYKNQIQMVMTSSKLPSKIDNLAERLRSRFSMGLIVNILPPDAGASAEIITSKAKLHGIKIPQDVVAFIASIFSHKNIRYMEGALTRLSAVSSFTGKPIDINMAESELKDLGYDVDNG